MSDSPTKEEEEPPLTAATEPSDETVRDANDKAPLPSAVEFEPPLACIRRILKNALPASTNVGKDASAAFCRASGIFIIYLTSCANDFARENKRQTITANDVLSAIKELDFDEFTPEMLAVLESYRQSEKSKKNAKAAAKKEESLVIPTTPHSDEEDLDEDDEEDDEGRKRTKGEETDSDEEETNEKEAKRLKQATTEEANEEEHAEVQAEEEVEEEEVVP